MKLESWNQSDNTLQKTYVFSSFEAAIRFMALASTEIDVLNHHPEWTNIYNKVMVTLRTHDSGNVVTDLDYKLAELLDRVFAGEVKK
jgi:4a-hydroxytetrahydrobiopterin dehydratase